MKIQKMAALIPAEYRKEILDLNMIETARLTADDYTMHNLCVIFKDYIEKDFDPACPLCYARVIKFFKQIKPALEELEKQSRLLDSILDEVEKDFNHNEITAAVRRRSPGDEKL